MKTESEHGWETDGGALHGPRVRCAVCRAPVAHGVTYRLGDGKPVCSQACASSNVSDRFCWTDGDTLHINVVGMSARSCASCGVPLTLEREIHVCTECAKKGGA